MLSTLKMNYFNRFFSTEQESPIHRKSYSQMKLLVSWKIVFDYILSCIAYKENLTSELFALR